LSSNDRWDVAVIGAGFGGLGAALTLAERGARVVLCESLNYPGGCASSFRRGGFSFDAGATLFAGLAQEQLFGGWVRRYGLDVQVDWPDPVVELRAPGLVLPVERRRDALLERFCAMPSAPVRGLETFFADQRRTADLLWGTFDRPDLLPPFDAASVLTHLRRLPRYLLLLRQVGRSLDTLLARHGLERFEPLRIYLDALCQITVQCNSRQAEAPLALAAMDYTYRGAGHVRGGIGRLAWGLLEAARRLGVDVRLPNRVRGLRPCPSDGWCVETREGSLRAGRVVANLLPQSLLKLLGAPPGAHPSIDRLARRVSQGWGAAMLYLAARAPEATPQGPLHLELIQETAEPFTDGNHLFVSVGGSLDGQPSGHRTLTVSTHVTMDTLRNLDPPRQAEHMADIHRRMRRGLRSLAPEWAQRVSFDMTASPRTFERFTGRHAGFVGGVPRRSGLHNYLDSGPREVLPGLHIVGDSVLPGQGTLPAALGGVRLASRLVA
jgi:phytoene dehydrogenase-like protein